MIVADTGAMLALVDADDRHHGSLRRIFEERPDAWVLPWAILPEVDYLLATRVGQPAQAAFISDLADGAYSVEWGVPSDLERTRQLSERYASLRPGLVDCSVIAIAERLAARAIATLDLRHFGAIEIRGRPQLLPRDL